VLSAALTLACAVTSGDALDDALLRGERDASTDAESVGARGVALPLAELRTADGESRPLALAA